MLRMVRWGFVWAAAAALPALAQSALAQPAPVEPSSPAAAAAEPAPVAPPISASAAVKTPEPAPKRSEWIACDGLWSWVASQCRGLKKAWKDGSPDLYITGLSHHDRGTYTQEKIDSYNERAWGGGLGWSARAENGDDFGWYFLVFRDSHYKYTKMVGWDWLTYWPADGKVAVGLGYTMFLGSRPDIYNSIPFPGILPLASVRLWNAEIMGTYIPKVSQGTTGNGNVGFLFGRIHF